MGNCCENREYEDPKLNKCETSEDIMLYLKKTVIKSLKDQNNKITDCVENNRRYKEFAEVSHNELVEKRILNTNIIDSLTNIVRMLETNDCTVSLNLNTRNLT